MKKNKWKRGAHNGNMTIIRDANKNGMIEDDETTVAQRKMATAPDPLLKLIK